VKKQNQLPDWRLKKRSKATKRCEKEQETRTREERFPRQRRSGATRNRIASKEEGGLVAQEVGRSGHRGAARLKGAADQLDFEKKAGWEIEKGGERIQGNGPVEDRIVAGEGGSVGGLGHSLADLARRRAAHPKRERKPYGKDGKGRGL